MPGIRPVLIGDGPQRAWLAARLPDAKFTGALETGDLTRAVAALDVLVHPGTRRPAATHCARPRRAAYPSSHRAPVAHPTWWPLETGLLYDPADPHGLSARSPRWPATGIVPCWARRGRELAVRRDWPAAVDELVERHYAALVGTPTTAPRAA